MEIIIKKQNLAPMFENVIIQKIKNNNKKELIKKNKINIENKNYLTLISEKIKPVSFKSFFNKSIIFVKLYDKNLYLFLKKISNKNKGILEPKDSIIENKKLKKKIKIVPKSELLKTYLSQYGKGKIKMLNNLKKNKKFLDKKDIKKKELLNSTTLLTKKENKEKSEEKKKILPNIYKYIKTISNFNLELAKFQNIVYQFNKSNKTSSTSINKNIFTILEYSFFTMSSLISKPIFVNSSSKVIIQLFYYLNKKNKSKSPFVLNNRTKKISLRENNSKFLSLNEKKLQLLCYYFSKLYKKPVELELDRLYYPYFDSNILSNMIGLISNIVKFRFIIRKLFSVAKLKKTTNLFKIRNRNSIIPSFLSGIKIRLAGRLLTQRVIPRLTVKNIQRGTLARGKANFVNSARFTNKNKRGAYSITVTLGHIFF